MTITYFLSFHADHKPGVTVSGADQARFTRIVKATPGLAKALLFTPASAHDPYLHDGPPPMLATQLYFPNDPGNCTRAASPTRGDSPKFAS